MILNTLMSGGGLELVEFSVSKPVGGTSYINDPTLIGTVPACLMIMFETSTGNKSNNGRLCVPDNQFYYFNAQVNSNLYVTTTSYGTFGAASYSFVKHNSTYSFAMIYGGASTGGAGSGTDTFGKLSGIIIPKPNISVDLYVGPPNSTNNSLTGSTTYTVSGYYVTQK